MKKGNRKSTIAAHQPVWTPYVPKSSVPTECGQYYVTLKSGGVETDMWHQNQEENEVYEWLCFADSLIIAFCGPTHPYCTLDE